MSTIRPLPELVAPMPTKPAPPTLTTTKLSYSVREAADALGVSDKTVWGFINDGLLSTFALPGLKRTLIKTTDLVAFVHSQPSELRLPDEAVA